MSAFDGLIDTLLDASVTPSAFATGMVEVVKDNSPKPPTVSVRWQGVLVTAICLRHYTPVVGHQVFMARYGPQLVIQGAL